VQIVDSVSFRMVHLIAGVGASLRERIQTGADESCLPHR